MLPTETDRLALTAIYKSCGMNDDYWINWASNKPLCEWEDVKTTESGRVKVLFLQEGLVGNLPQEIGYLTELETLCFYKNNLKGTIPDTIGNLRKLVRLLLMDNFSLSGRIPQEIGNLTNLTEIDLSENMLSGPIPHEIGNLAKLTILDLSQNKLTGTIPPRISSLLKLEKLNLRNNHLRGRVPLSFGKLTKLKCLLVRGNNIDYIERQNGDFYNQLVNRIFLDFRKYSANVKTCLHGTIVGKRGSYQLPAELIECHVAPYLISPPLCYIRDRLEVWISWWTIRGKRGLLKLPSNIIKNNVVPFLIFPPEYYAEKGHNII